MSNEIGKIGGKIDRQYMLRILEAKAGVATICDHTEREVAFLEMAEIVKRMPAA